MNRIVAVSLVLASLAAPALGQDEPKPKDEGGPLAPLKPIGEHLDKGIAAFLAGKAPAEAFAPWKARARSLTPLREELKASGATAAVNMGFELELVFLKETKPVFYLRTFVCTLDGRPAFVSFSGRRVGDGKLYVKGRPLGDYKGAAEPFAKAAAALLEALKDKEQVAKLPVVELAALKKHLGLDERAEKNLEADLERTKRNLARAHKAIGGVRHDEVHLRIDDQTFALKGAAGTGVGLLRCGFELTPEGELSYRLSNLRGTPRGPQPKGPEKTPEPPKEPEKKTE